MDLEIFEKRLPWMVVGILFVISLGALAEIVPLMGMQKYWKDVKPHDLVTSYVTGENPGQTRSDSHGGFDNDLTTMNYALRVVLSGKPATSFEKEHMDYG